MTLIWLQNLVADDEFLQVINVDWPDVWCDVWCDAWCVMCDVWCDVWCDV